MHTRRLFLQMASALSIPTVAGGGVMSYFTPAQHAAILADPSYISTLYAAERGRFLSDLGTGFAGEIEEHYKLGFCGLLAFDLKPYGGSVAVGLAELLSAPALDCDNYVILTWRLFNILNPVVTTNIAAVGWNGGPFGNHAQLIAQKPAGQGGLGGGYWLIDPTVGIFTCGHDFDYIAGGNPMVSSLYLKDFYASCGRYGTVTDWLHIGVKNALLGGLYRPSHLLYYYVDLERYVDPVPIADWPTPQSSAMSP
jgi:hypothetical protein